jgi:signal transduction histidine kinase
MSSGSDSDDRNDRQGRLAPRVGLDDAGIAEQRTFFELGDADDALLREFRAIAEASVDGVVDEFYRHLLAVPVLRELLEREPGRIERLRALQRAYFLSLTDGALDDAYVESRLRVGNAHQTIGLEPSWYIGAFGLYLRLTLRELVARTGDGARILPTIEALVKIITFDMALAMRTYVYGGFVSRAVAEHLERAATLAEDALEARADTERLKEELSAMVVHDLKNPVNGILMMVQLALRKGADLPETHRSYLQQIDLTCREMMRLIQNLLEISKIEEGKMPITIEPVVLAELVDEVLVEHRPLASQAGRRLEIDVSTALPAVAADRALLRRVLANLIGNAVRHSGSPVVYVEARPDAGGERVLLAVRDEGRGIPASQHARIFEKFASVRRSPTDEPFRDTGLGLPFCKLAVDQMGGDLSLASALDTGSTFVVTLPVHRRA